MPATNSPKRRRRPRHSSTLSPAIAPPGPDTSIGAAAGEVKGPLVTCPVSSVGSEQDIPDGAADAGGVSLAADAGTDNQLRVRPPRQLRPDALAQPRHHHPPALARR